MTLGVFKQGKASCVIFFHPGEEGTYVENVDVTLYENGFVHLQSSTEETTVHLRNIEIIWQFKKEAESKTGSFRLLRLKGSDKPAGP